MFVGLGLGCFVKISLFFHRTYWNKVMCRRHWVSFVVSDMLEKWTGSHMWHDRVHRLFVMIFFSEKVAIGTAHSVARFFKLFWHSSTFLQLGKRLNADLLVFFLMHTLSTLCYVSINTHYAAWNNAPAHIDQNHTQLCHSGLFLWNCFDFTWLSCLIWEWQNLEWISVLECDNEHSWSGCKMTTIRQNIKCV